MTSVKGLVRRFFWGVVFWWLEKWVQKVNARHSNGSATLQFHWHLRWQQGDMWCHLVLPFEAPVVLFLDSLFPLWARFFLLQTPLTKRTHATAQYLLLSPGRCVWWRDIARVEDVSRASVDLRSYPVSPRPHPLFGRIVACCRHLALSRTL